MKKGQKELYQGFLDDFYKIKAVIVHVEPDLY